MYFFRLYENDDETALDLVLITADHHIANKATLILYHHESIYVSTSRLQISIKVY